jgi:hypothetical protein
LTKGKGSVYSVREVIILSTKNKSKKIKAPRKTVIRKVPNINLLKHLNVVLLLAGFLSSLVIISVLASHSSENYDVRSRGQVKPTVTPAVTPAPSTITPTVFQER